MEICVPLPGTLRTSKRPPMDCVRSRIVCVDQIGVPRPENRSYPTCCGEVPVAAHAHRGDRDASASQPTNERRVRSGDHQRLVTMLTLPAREQIDLALSATPFSAGVQVEDAKRL